MKSINTWMSLFMSFSAIAYMVVMGMFWPEGVNAPLIVAIPPLALLASAMWFLVKPDTKVEI